VPAELRDCVRVTLWMADSGPTTDGPIKAAHQHRPLHRSLAEPHAKRSRGDTFCRQLAAAWHGILTAAIVNVIGSVRGPGRLQEVDHGVQLCGRRGLHSYGQHCPALGDRTTYGCSLAYASSASSSAARSHTWIAQAMRPICGQGGG
jgi:hypothetical protein